MEWKLHLESRVITSPTESSVVEFPIVELEDGYKLWLTPKHKKQAEMIASCPTLIREVDSLKNRVRDLENQLEECYQRSHE